MNAPYSRQNETFPKYAMVLPMIDMRSDFVSRPTEEMIRAMAAEAAEAPAFGLREDPMQRRLEARAAEMLGKEDALFCPTCTVANQIAIRLFCQPGQTVVARDDAHVATTEAPSAALTNVKFRLIPGQGARMAPEDVAASTRPGDVLLVLENTHVRSGGRVMPIAEMVALQGVARANGLRVHLDGSRIFNAASSLGVPASVLAANADTVAVSLNKGLAAPMGAVLAGSREAIEQAVHIRTQFGAAWRPANIPAAAALVALNTMVDRLEQDHGNARTLAQELGSLDGVTVDPAQVESNIVLIRLSKAEQSIAAFLSALEKQGVLGLAFGPDVIRLAVWWGIGAAEVARTVSAFAAVLRA